MPRRYLIYTMLILLVTAIYLGYTSENKNSVSAIVILFGSVGVAVAAQLGFARLPLPIKQRVRWVLTRLAVGALWLGMINVAVFLLINDFPRATQVSAIVGIVAAVLLVMSRYAGFSGFRRRTFDQVGNWLFWGSFGLAILLIPLTALFSDSSPLSLAFAIPFLLLVAWIFYMWWGMILTWRGNVDGAIQHYSNILRLNSTSLMARTSRASLLSNTGKYEESLADYNAAIGLAPNNSDIYVSRASVYIFQHDYPRALADCQTAIRLRPESPNGYTNLASVHVGMGDYDAAIEDCNTGLKLLPSGTAQVLLYFHRAKAAASKGDFAPALADFDAALQPTLSNKDRTSVETLVIPLKAVTLYAIGQADEAVRLWQTAVVKKPNFQDVEWIEREHRWSEPLMEQARKLIAASAH